MKSMQAAAFVVKKTSQHLSAYAMIGALLLGASPVHAAKKISKEEALKQEDLQETESSLQAIERLLNREKNPYHRTQLLLRWVKAQDKLEQDHLGKTENGAAQYKAVKSAILSRLQVELPNLEKFGNSPELEILYREIGYRLLEVQKYAESANYFGKVTRRTSDDEMAYGDSLIGAKNPQAAVQAYTRSGQDARLKDLAAYKKGWADLQLGLFSEALREFDYCVSPAAVNLSARMKEESYKDRLRPYLENFSKMEFTDSDSNALLNLAANVYPKDEKAQHRIFVEFLEALIGGFNSKAQVRKAEDVFKILVRFRKDSDEVLYQAAPLWLKVYRSQLDHSSVERVLNNLPKTTLTVSAPELEAELNNTALFYETLITDYDSHHGQDKDAMERDSYKKILRATYAKYFVLFPKSPDSTPLRVNYARLELDAGDTKACVAILAPRNKKDATVEKLAAAIEAKCQLKDLDQLYAAQSADKVDPTFVAKLNETLFEKKLYARQDLDLGNEIVYNSLVSMLISSLKKEMKSTELRGMLAKATETYPYSKSSPTYKNMQLVGAELNFEDIAGEESPKPSDKAVAGAEGAVGGTGVGGTVTTVAAGDSAKAEQFYKIFKDSPQGSAVSQKALYNAVIVDGSEKALERCSELSSVSPGEWRVNSLAFKHCLAIAEQNILADREYQLWKSVAVSDPQGLKLDHQLRIGLLELGLGHETEGKKRLSALKSKKAEAVLAAWTPKPMDEVPPKKEREVVKQLYADADFFTSRLKTIRFDQIGKAVPERVQKFKEFESSWNRIYKGERDGVTQAKLIELRAKVFRSMAEWFDKLPEPKGLDDKQMETYKSKAKEIVKPWIEKADAALKACSEQIYVITPEFKERKANFCREATPEATMHEQLVKWQKTRQDPKTSIAEDTPNGKRFHQLVKAADRADKKTLSKYWLILALDLSNSPYDQAQIQVRMAKIDKSERLYRQVYRLDGNLKEAIEYVRNKDAKGNPFYERLYDKQIELSEKDQPVGEMATERPSESGAK